MKALKATNLADHAMIGPPIKFDEKGQNVDIPLELRPEPRPDADGGAAGRRRHHDAGAAGAAVAGPDLIRRNDGIDRGGVASRRDAPFINRSRQRGLEFVMAAITLNVIVQGLLTGLVYGLMALGLSVIFGVMRVVNFAHGEFTVVGDVRRLHPVRDAACSIR